MSIEVRQVSKGFGGGGPVLDGVSLKVDTGELVALLGPSGAGKTTLLRIIAGLDAPDGGSVLFDDEDLTERRVRDRGVGFVFQHYALFRHMTIFENVAFGLRVKPRAQRPTREQLRERVMSLLALVQLDGLASRYPAQLSGGQRQRVALARALAVEPKVLLLDEPFGALDAKVRQELRRWLRRLHDELHVTSVLVTHDQEEALEVADRVVVMRSGRIEQAGTPEEVYHSPATPFVCRFLGHANFFHGRVDQGLLRLGDLSLPAPEHALVLDTPALACARPHEIELSTTATALHAGRAVVRYINAAGPVVRVELEMPGSAEPLLVECTRARRLELGLAEGSAVYFKLSNLRLFVGPAASLN